MDEQSLFDEAIRDWLLNEPAITAKVSDRIYFDEADPGALTPHIIISWQSWNEVHDRTIVQEIDATANVRCVVDLEQDDQDARLAVQIADAITARMRGAALAVAGWGIHWCRIRNRHRTPRLINRNTYSSAGAFVQIGAIKA